MVSDRTENEPDEYDPEAEFRDPDSDSITIPRVPTEDAGSGLWSDLRSEMEADEAEIPDLSSSETDVDGETLQHFWALVFVINVAVLAFALSLMFLIFEGNVTYSAYLLAAALVFTGFGIRRYRNFKRATDASSTADNRDDDPDEREPEASDEPLELEDEPLESEHSDDTTADSK
ncbi:DUF7322 domain-containing protein [Natronorubrum halophilum]|uniref:DUF7322 domain-containing protein n=1 Tax=Natronorubrum halophilum TaxID=1702106 RepID=UPI001EE997F1|nr:hypothetical protein [Natronorubrum halophilum]